VITPEDLQRLQMTMAPRLADILAQLPPDAAQAWLGGFIANMIGPLPQEHWNNMRAEAAAPCDQPDCGCEVFKSKVMDALNILREDWREQTGKY